MASGAAGDGLLRGMFEGCISGVDTGIQRRPYHKNCKCALHKLPRGHGKHASSPCSNVSYPIRRSWSEGCLALMMNPSTREFTSPCRSSSSSPRVTAAATMGDILRTQTQLVLFIEEEDEEVEQSVSFSSKV